MSKHELRAEDDHELLHEADVEFLRPDKEIGFHVVEGDRELGRVVDEIVEQDLRRGHRQEGEHDRGDRHAEHVAEVRAQGHHQVLERVCERLSPLHDAVDDFAEAFFEKNDVGRLLRDIHGVVHGNADIGLFDRQHVVHAVAHVRYDMAVLAQGSHDPLFVLRRDAGEDIGRFDVLAQAGLVHF